MPKHLREQYIVTHLSQEEKLRNGPCYVSILEKFFDAAADYCQVGANIAVILFAIVFVCSLFVS